MCRLPPAQDALRWTTSTVHLQLVWTELAQFTLCQQKQTHSRTWLDMNLTSLNKAQNITSSHQIISTPNTWISELSALFPNFEMLDAKIASAQNKIIQNSHLKKEVFLEEQKAQQEDWFLRSWQIAFMIYDYSRVTGAHDPVLDYVDLLSVTLRNWWYSGIRYKVGWRFVFCQIFHPMTSWEVCTDWEHVSPNNSRLYYNCTTWRLIRRYDGEEEKRLQTPNAKLWRQARDDRNRSSGQESKRLKWR